MKILSHKINRENYYVLKERSKNKNKNNRNQENIKKNRHNQKHENNTMDLCCLALKPMSKDNYKEKIALTNMEIKGAFVSMKNIFQL